MVWIPRIPQRLDYGTPGDYTNFRDRLVLCLSQLVDEVDRPIDPKPVATPAIGTIRSFASKGARRRGS